MKLGSDPYIPCVVEKHRGVKCRHQRGKRDGPIDDGEKIERTNEPTKTKRAQRLARANGYIYIFYIYISYIHCCTAKHIRTNGHTDKRTHKLYTAAVLLFKNKHNEQNESVFYVCNHCVHASARANNKMNTYIERRSQMCMLCMRNRHPCLPSRLLTALRRGQ